MRLNHLPFALVVAVGACSAGSQSSAGPAPSSAAASAAFAAAISQTRAFISDTMKTLGAPGASITVMKDGRIVWSEGFGFADLEQRVPVTPLTKFRIGSVSKPLTSAALGILYQEGKLDLDAPIQRYVPNFPAKRYPITVRQVAGHVAGIRHYRDGEFESRKHYNTVLEGLTIFRDDSLLFEPGTRFSYSSYGWNLISAVIEGAAGEPFLTFMQRRVLAPAGLTHTIAEHPDSLIEYRARFYTRGDSGGPILNAPYVDNSYKWAGGGYLSTTEDLARFGQAMLDGQLLRAETVKLLWTSLHTADGRPTNYGLGWSIRTDSLGRERVFHSGGSMGGTAMLIVYPNPRLIVAVLVNSDRTFIGATPRIAEWFLGAAQAGSQP